MTSIQELYGELWAEESALERELERSLEPRGTDWLFETFAALGPKPGELVVDVGSRDAAHTIRLVREHQLRAIALDPVSLHAERARRAVAEAGLEDAVEIVEAGIEAMPLADGLADWIVSVNVIAATTSSANFAGIGHGEITGQVFDTTTHQGVPGAIIRCSWSGFDDIVGNDDDMVFAMIADATGSFDMAGVPYGYFTCGGLDSVTGRQSRAVAMSEFSPEAVNALLPVGADPGASGTLPKTGDDSFSTLALALLVLTTGVGTTVMARRRKA